MLSWSKEEEGKNRKKYRSEFFIGQDGYSFSFRQLSNEYYETPVARQEAERIHNYEEELRRRNFHVTTNRPRLEGTLYYGH